MQSCTTYIITITVLVSLAILPSSIIGYPVRRWTYAENEGDTNYDFGKAFGIKFNKEINVRLASDKSLEKLVDEFGRELDLNNMDYSMSLNLICLE